jgi:hypothetical protein
VVLISFFLQLKSQFPTVDQVLYLIDPGNHQFITVISKPDLTMSPTPSLSSRLSSLVSQPNGKTPWLCTASNTHLHIAKDRAWFVEYYDLGPTRSTPHRRFSVTMKKSNKSDFSDTIVTELRVRGFGIVELPVLVSEEKNKQCVAVRRLVNVLHVPSAPNNVLAELPLAIKYKTQHPCTPGSKPTVRFPDWLSNGLAHAGEEGVDMQEPREIEDVFEPTSYFGTVATADPSLKPLYVLRLAAEVTDGKIWIKGNVSFEPSVSLDDWCGWELELTAEEMAWVEERYPDDSGSRLKGLAFWIKHGLTPYRDGDGLKAVWEVRRQMAMEGRSALKKPAPWWEKSARK